jgi:hypothetical protein
MSASGGSVIIGSNFYAKVYDHVEKRDGIWYQQLPTLYGIADNSALQQQSVSISARGSIWAAGYRVAVAGLAFSTTTTTGYVVVYGA